MLSIVAFVKSVVAGLAAVILTGVLGTCAIIAIASWQLRKYLFSDGYYYITPEFHLGRILFTSALIFAVGFWWQYRRAVRS